MRRWRGGSEMVLVSRDGGSAGVKGSSWAVPGILFTVVVWGSYFPVLEVLLAGWDPMTLSWVRALLAGGTLVALLVMVEGRGSLHVGVPWARVWVLGSLGMAFNMTLMTFGIQFSGAVPAALIAGTSPALAALMARFLYRQPMTTDTWVAVLLAVGGVAIVVLGGASLQADFRGGEFIVLASYLLWLWYLFAAQRWLPGMSQLRLSSLTMGAGAVSLTAIYAFLCLVGYGPIAADGSAMSVALLVYSAVFSVGIGVVLWNLGVSRLGVTVTALYGNLVPIVAVAISVAMGVRVSWLQLLGGALVLVGVLYIQLRPRLRHGPGRT